MHWACTSSRHCARQDEMLAETHSLITDMESQQWQEMGFSESGSGYLITCLDIGTGTGILLMAAHHLGIRNLVGIDLEEEAAIQAKKNCEHNGIDAIIIHGNLSDDFHGKAHLILANLTVDPLKILLPMIREKLHDNGILIISGIVDNRYDEIMPYITEHWSILEEMVEGPWHTFALV